MRTAAGPAMQKRGACANPQSTAKRRLRGCGVGEDGEGSVPTKNAQAGFFRSRAGLLGARACARRHLLVMQDAERQFACDSKTAPRRNRPVVVTEKLRSQRRREDAGWRTVWSRNIVEKGDGLRLRLILLRALHFYKAPELRQAAGHRRACRFVEGRQSLVELFGILRPEKRGRLRPCDHCGVSQFGIRRGSAAG